MILSLSAAGAMLSSDELRTYIFSLPALYIWGGLGGGVGWANNVLALAYLLYFYTTSSYVKISLS